MPNVQTDGPDGGFICEGCNEPQDGAYASVQIAPSVYVLMCLTCAHKKGLS